MYSTTGLSREHVVDLCAMIHSDPPSGDGGGHRKAGRWRAGQDLTWLTIKDFGWLIALTCRFVAGGERMCALNRGRSVWPVYPLPADREDRVEASGGAGRVLVPSGIAGHRAHRVSARQCRAGGAEGRRAAMRYGQSRPSSLTPLPRHGEAGLSDPRGARLDCQTSASLETAKVTSMVAALAPGERSR
jgi:hypothetical protein